MTTHGHASASWAAFHGATCPRCGYDQRGAMATWTAQGSCPLEGTCAECGLTFDWIDVIDPGRLKPMWCVEYAERRRVAMLTSMVKTAAHQALPWLFWRRVAMHHEPRFGRIILYVLLLLVTVYPALMIGQGMAAWELYHTLFVWPTPPPPNPPPTITEWQAVGWSMMLPLSATSPGAYLAGGAQWIMFPTPLELLQRKWSYGWSGSGLIMGYPRLGMLAAFWSSLLVFMPLSFALLPQTRRKSKVRWAHIIRIGLYAAAFTTPLLWWVAIWQVPHFGVLGMLGMCGINLAWWGWACSAYLRLPRPWFVASMLTFMLLMLGATVLFYMMPHLFVSQMVS